MTPDTTDAQPTTTTAQLYPQAAASGRDPSRAIETKKAQATANRDRITTAIVALQRQDQPVNVQSVARAAGVHPATLRRNPDLLAEVQRLRDASWQQPPARHADPEATASSKALKARLLASQQEGVELRRQLTQLRRDAHQALGTASTHPDHGMVEELQREAAELRVQLMDERDTTRGLQETGRDLADELTATREIARGYLRDLDQARADLRATRQELMKLRTQIATDCRRMS
ncbi:hypothetical protein [Actinoplanes derwentensis]|uniref:Uncharacterized protein n=1 Tax=Actinoplanes derwentensis TaxID=113562 RepID=A0A1H1VRF1_9ACTN|nr:hypothetical protein [Actinoplanes derwentensis]GID83603.1 hypothetical protein Ade03nite_25270 [Actinoplanes derwentensis]SDS87538.1 hypothetical protein SAMN04489716_1858 [Actinoplanes derwentensis]